MSGEIPLKLLTFRLSDQAYGVDIMSVCEIRGWSKSTPLPHAPSFMKGVINLRGTVLPVIDLADRLGLLAQDQTTRSVIIVVSLNDTVTGLLVDAVSDIITLTPQDLQAPPDIAGVQGNSVVHGLSLVDDQMIRILDLGAVITTTEIAAA